MSVPHPIVFSSNLPYMGIEERTPRENYVRRRDPTQRDYNSYKVGDRWVNKATDTVWMLTNKTNGIATWVTLGGGGAPLSSLTGNDLIPVLPVGNNINVQGSAGGAILFTSGGAGQLNAAVQVDGVTIAIVGNQLTLAAPIPPSSFPTDAGIAVPAAGVLNILGTAAQGVSTSGAGNTVTITTADASTASKGVAQFDPDDFTVTAGVVSLLGAAMGTATTVGAVTADVITFPLAGGTVTQFDILVAGYEASTPAGCGYAILGMVRQNGGTATLDGTTPDITINEAAALVTAHANLVVSGANAVVRVTGAAGLTINWRASLRSVTAP